MRVTDLIVSSERGVLAGQRNQIFRRRDWIARRAHVNLIDESVGFDFSFEFWQVLNEEIDNCRIEVRAGAFTQQLDRFFPGHAGAEGPFFAH